MHKSNLKPFHSDDIHIHVPVDTISMELPIMYFKGLLVKISIK